MKRAISIIVLSIILASPAWSQELQKEKEPENYCDQSWDEWGELVRKYPNDMDIQTLHALRIGLCAKIKEGTISTVDAIVLFERARAIIVEKTRQEKLENNEQNL
jgi:hypothetical protein